MDKSSIYKLINYNGTYNNEVKSKLKKLLKKYHPDHKNGNIEIFKLINEVKEELENNKVSIKTNSNINKKSTLSKEDEIFYKKKISDLIYQKEDLESKINNQEYIINDTKKEYNEINDKNLFNEEIICKNKNNMKYLLKFKKRYYLYMLLILSLVISLFITHSNYVLIGLIVIVIIMSIDVINIYLGMQKIVTTTSDFINNGIEYRNKSKEKKEELNNYKKDLVTLEHKLNNINNDIRFYENKLNNKK